MCPPKHCKDMMHATNSDILLSFSDTAGRKYFLSADLSPDSICA